MKVKTTSGHEVTLTQQHYVATGGQASVYVRGDTAYKVYTNPNDTIPEQKLRVLQQISDPNVVHPLEGLQNTNGSLIGYTMKAVSERKTLGQLFTKAFRNRNGVTVKTLTDLTLSLRTHISNIHASGSLIVDLNPFNVLVPAPHTDAFLIDVDSYQVAGYPATVILPSVRDYSVSAAQFSELSDWFSFAVLAFNLFVGCHPYRGSYPGLESMAPDEKMTHRMRGHLSAFRPAAKLPDCCYPMSDVPGGLLAWLRAVLDEGKRLPPPDANGFAVCAVAPIVATVPSAKAQLCGTAITVTLVAGFGGWEVTQHLERNGKTATMIGQGARIRIVSDGRDFELSPPGELFLGMTEQSHAPFVLAMREHEMRLFGSRHQLLDSKQADAVMEIDGRFYAKVTDSIVELQISEHGKEPQILFGTRVASVMENATALFSGCAIQSMFGSTYVSIFPRPGVGHQHRVAELDGARVLDAKFHGRALMAIVEKSGTRKLLRLILSEDFTSYGASWLPCGDIDELNFIALQNGIHAYVVEDGVLRAFTAAGKEAEFRDQAIGTGTRLTVCGGKLGVICGDKIYSVSTARQTG